MIKRGVMYMAWGENALEQAKASIASLRQFEPALPVAIVGDQQTLDELKTDDQQIECIVCKVDPFDENQKKGYKFLAGRIKPLLAGMSPFEQTLYVDADTYFLQSPSVGFDLLERWDIALAETQTRSLAEGIAGKAECDATSKEFGTGLLLYHNSGMIFWKKNFRTKALYDLWSMEWQRYQGWDEQVALLRAMLRSDVLFLTLPYTWNHSSVREAYLLMHWFGAGDARIDLKQRVREIKKTVAQERRSVPMVRVKLSGGQFVKCRPGEEEEILSRMINKDNHKKGREISMADRGPLVKVMKGHGQYVKMYQKDAEALGLVYEPEKKGRVPEGNKMREPEQNKADSSELIADSKEKEVKPEPAPVSPDAGASLPRNDKGQRPVALGTSLEQEQGSHDPLHIADASRGRSAREGAQLEDFTVISGVGKATDKALHEHGIDTFEDLMDADVSFLHGKAKSVIEAWRASVS